MSELAEAIRRRRNRFSLIWLVPIVAALISVYLAVSYLANRGPLITITFNSANGITAQQTDVKHKAVSLGTVEDVHLSRDLTHVVVHVRMNAQGKRVLTNHARFWVVRPRFNAGDISGLETLVSGAYIEVDPGEPGGEPQYEFRGLEEPPGVRSDEPGTTYRLRATRLGSLGPGSPVFYRDVIVGEVLSYDIGDGLGPVMIKAFVQAPYNRFVHATTHWWNASGLSANLGAQGFHIELESLQALVSGGVTFSTPRWAANELPSAPGAQFPLYGSEAEADAAGYEHNIRVVTYFTTSVAGLARGSPVQVFGLPIGIVTDVHLILGSTKGSILARVTFDLQPERVMSPSELRARDNPERVTARLVNQGMRAVLQSVSFITGQKAISLSFVPNAPSATIGQEGDAIVIPSQGGGLDNIMDAVSDITAKLDSIPFEDIGRNLNNLLRSADRTVGGPDLQNALRNLSSTLADVQRLVRHADAGLEPALKRLPQISADLQNAVGRANAMLGEGGYGGNSDFQRNVERLLDQVNDAARSIRLLADFLDRHPEALIRGRTAQAKE